MAKVSGNSVGEVCLGDRSGGDSFVWGAAEVTCVPDDSGCNVAGMHRMSSVLLKDAAIFVTFFFCVVVSINILTLSFCNKQKQLGKHLWQKKKPSYSGFSAPWLH